MSKNITNDSFKSKVIGTDPISKGTFTIEYAFMVWDEWEGAIINGEELKEDAAKYSGKIVITSENNNPLYKIAKEQPLRLQGLIASVQFGIEKRFVKIMSITDYGIEDDGVFGEIELGLVSFEILDGLEYLESVVTYKEENLL